VSAVEIENSTGPSLEDLENLKNPALYFSGKSLLLENVTAALLAFGSIGRGADHRLWVWSNGVWRVGEVEVHERLVDLLRGEYTPAHHIEKVGTLGT